MEKQSLGSDRDIREGHAGPKGGLVAQQPKRELSLCLLVSSAGFCVWLEPKILRDPGILGVKGRLPLASSRRSDLLRGHTLIAGSLGSLPAPSVLCAKEIRVRLSFL